MRRNVRRLNREVNDGQPNHQHVIENGKDTVAVDNTSAPRKGRSRKAANLAELQRYFTAAADAAAEVGLDTAPSPDALHACAPSTAQASATTAVPRPGRGAGPVRRVRCRPRPTAPRAADGGRRARARTGRRHRVRWNERCECSGRRGAPGVFARRRVCARQGASRREERARGDGRSDRRRSVRAGGGQAGGQPEVRWTRARERMPRHPFK